MKPHRQAIACMFLAAVCMLQVGCETKTQTGALTGAAVGTAAGALISHNAGGAAIGAGLGALAGGVIGMGMDESDRANAQAEAQAQASAQPRLRLVTYEDVSRWVKNNDNAHLNNLGQYQITASDLNKLNAAYANQRFSASDATLTTLQLAQLYGVICFFQSSFNPICAEPPALGKDSGEMSSAESTE